MINAQRHLSEFLKLIAISSESRNEAQIAGYLIGLFNTLGYDVTQDISSVKTGSSANNLFVRIPGTLPGPVIMFSAHMDTVVPGNNVTAIVNEDYITSDGKTILGADDKAGISAIIEMVRVFKERQLPHHDLLLCFSTAEEVGLMGAKAMDCSELQADYAYVLDCGGDIGTIINQAPFQQTFSVKVYGLAAHAGIEPEKGRSAIKAASHMIAELRLGRLDEGTTANIGLISGGAATNIVPDYTEFKGEVRSLDQTRLEDELASIRQTIKEQALIQDVAYEFISTREYDGYRFEPEDPSMQYLLKAMRQSGFEPKLVSSGGGSDANVFNAAGIPSLVLGIGMEYVHTKNERISKRNLNDLVQLLLHLASTPDVTP